MNDLDSRIREGLGDLIDATPIAPSFDRIIAQHRRAPTRMPSGVHRRTAVPVAVASVLVALVGAVVGFGLSGSSGHGARLSTIKLATYSARLPSGFVLSAAASSNCQVIPTGGLPMDVNTVYTVETPTATACIGSEITATYIVSSPASTKDPAPPAAATPLEVGAYRAEFDGAASQYLELCHSATGEPSCAQATLRPGTLSAQSLVAIWVQIPSTGGGYHDLVVAAIGLTKSQLIAMTASALPANVTPAAGGKPPWSFSPPSKP